MRAEIETGKSDLETLKKEKLEALRTAHGTSISTARRARESVCSSLSGLEPEQTWNLNN
jgi:hypothetical protein